MTIRIRTGPPARKVLGEGHPRFLHGDKHAPVCFACHAPPKRLCRRCAEFACENHDCGCFDGVFIAGDPTWQTEIDRRREEHARAVRRGV